MRSKEKIQEKLLESINEIHANTEQEAAILSIGIGMATLIEIFTDIRDNLTAIIDIMQRK